MNRKDEILKLFPKELRALLGQVPAEFEDTGDPPAGGRAADPVGPVGGMGRVRNRAGDGKSRDSRPHLYKTGIGGDL